METIIVGLVAAGSALLVQGLGFYFNRKSGLAPAQAEYQDTLEGMNKALSGRVTDLEQLVERQSLRIKDLEDHVLDLERQLRETTRENYELTRELLQAQRQ
jgi:chromosome segregation ATPase